MFTEALYQMKQTIKTDRSKISELQAQVEELEATSTEKDTLLAIYEAIVKDSQGDNSEWYEIHEIAFFHIRPIV